MITYNPRRMREGSDDLHSAGRRMVGYVMDFTDSEIASQRVAGDKPSLLSSTHRASTNVTDLLSALAVRSQDVAQKIIDAADQVEANDNAYAQDVAGSQLHSGLQIT